MNEIFQFTARELGDHPRLGLPGLVGPEPRIATDSNVFVASVSHEVRNSLGAIRSATRILCVDTSACAVEKARMLIERQVAKITSLIDDLLDVSRSQHTPMRLQCGRNDLCAIAAHAAQAVGFTMQQRNHQMATSSPEAPMWVQADTARLEQPLVNLLINAAKYADPGGQIGPIVAREDGEAVIRVRDNGTGIDPEVRPHAFDLFVQADPSSRRTDAGLGIGLALGAQRGQSPRRSCYRVKRGPRARKRVCDPFASACGAADRSGVGADRRYPHLAAQQIVGLRSERHCRGDSADRGRSALVGPAIAFRCRTIRSSAVSRRQIMNSQPPAGPQDRGQEDRITPQDHRRASGPSPKDQDRNNESAPDRGREK
jgi:two-component sensor histidine kinase